MKIINRLIEYAQMRCYYNQRFLYIVYPAAIIQV
jgi:hypothetical protein